MAEEQEERQPLWRVELENPDGPLDKENLRHSHERNVLEDLDRAEVAYTLVRDPKHRRFADLCMTKAEYEKYRGFVAARAQKWVS